MSRHLLRFLVHRSEVRHPIQRLAVLDHLVLAFVVGLGNLSHSPSKDISIVLGVLRVAYRLVSGHASVVDVIIHRQNGGKGVAHFQPAVEGTRQELLFIERLQSIARVSGDR